MKSDSRNENEHPRLDWHLDNWARYMREDEAEQLDCKIVDFWQAGSADFDGMADHMERRCAMAMDAIVGDLPIAERLAVHHIHLHAVWRINRVGVTMEEVYLRARVSISDGLRRKGIS